MKKLILSILLLAVIIISCSKNNSADTKDTFDYFNTHLTTNMVYADLVNKFGEPDVDIGSGIHIYVYRLSDSTAIIIGYTDKILYAKHVDSNQQVLHIII